MQPRQVQTKVGERSWILETACVTPTRNVVIPRTNAQPKHSWRRCTFRWGEGRGGRSSILRLASHEVAIQATVCNGKMSTAKLATERSMATISDANSCLWKRPFRTVWNVQPKCFCGAWSILMCFDCDLAAWLQKSHVRWTFATGCPCSISCKSGGFGLFLQYDMQKSECTWPQGLNGLRWIAPTGSQLPAGQQCTGAVGEVDPHYESIWRHETSFNIILFSDLQCAMAETCFL